MLGFVFGFRIRLARMHFFLSTIALALLMTAYIFAIVAYAFKNSTPGTGPAVESFVLPALCAMPVFLWITCNLYSMRIRDIGWNPAYIVPVWVLITVIDTAVAVQVPAWSVGREHAETPVGLCINLVLTLALLFWPSSPYDVSSPPAARIPTRRPEVTTIHPAAPIAPSQQPWETRSSFGLRRR